MKEVEDHSDLHLGDIASIYSGLNLTKGEKREFLYEGEGSEGRACLERGSNVKRFRLRWSDVWIRGERASAGAREEVWGSPKILIRKFSRHLVSAVDFEGRFCTLDSLLSIVLQRTDEDPSLMLAALSCYLNSTLCDEYYQRFREGSGSRSRSQYLVTARLLKSLPLPSFFQAKDDEDRELIKQLAGIYEKLEENGLDRRVRRHLHVEVETLLLEAFGMERPSQPRVERGHERRGRRRRGRRRSYASSDMDGDEESKEGQTGKLLSGLEFPLSAEEWTTFLGSLEAVIEDARATEVNEAVVFLTGLGARKRSRLSTEQNRELAKWLWRVLPKIPRELRVKTLEVLVFLDHSDKDVLLPMWSVRDLIERSLEPSEGEIFDFLGDSRRHRNIAALVQIGEDVKAALKELEALGALESLPRNLHGRLTDLLRGK